MKQNPDLSKINKSQNHLQDIQNYKATGLKYKVEENSSYNKKNQINFPLTKKSKNKNIKL